MFSYICFINESEHPAISVFSDEEEIFDSLLKGTESEYIKTLSGSIDFCFTENRNKPFLRVWVSLFPGEKYRLIVKNSKAFFK